MILYAESIWENIKFGTNRIKIELSAAEVKRKARKLIFRSCAVHKKFLDPRIEFHAKFPVGNYKEKIFIVKYAFARKINIQKFLKIKNFKKLRKTKIAVKKRELAQKGSKLGKIIFFCVYFRPNLLWSTFRDPTMQSYIQFTNIDPSNKI